MSDEIATLAARVRWLDHSRRNIRRVIALVVSILAFLVLPDLLGPPWPRFHARLMGIAFGLALAFMVDLAIAGMTTWWEVRHDHLVRDRWLPRAVLRRRGR